AGQGLERLPDGHGDGLAHRVADRRVDALAQDVDDRVQPVQLVAQGLLLLAVAVRRAAHGLIPTFGGCYVGFFLVEVSSAPWAGPAAPPSRAPAGRPPPRPAGSPRQRLVLTGKREREVQPGAQGLVNACRPACRRPDPGRRPARSATKPRRRPRRP